MVRADRGEQQPDSRPSRERPERLPGLEEKQNAAQETTHPEKHRQAGSTTKSRCCRNLPQNNRRRDSRNPGHQDRPTTVRVETRGRLRQATSPIRHQLGDSAARKTQAVHRRCGRHVETSTVRTGVSVVQAHPHAPHSDHVLAGGHSVRLHSGPLATTRQVLQPEEGERQARIQFVYTPFFYSLRDDAGIHLCQLMILTMNSNVHQLPEKLTEY